MFANVSNGLDCFLDKHHMFTNQTIDDQNRYQEGTYLWSSTWEKALPALTNQVACKICPGCFNTVFETQPKLICISPYGSFYYGHACCVRNGLQFTKYILKAEKITPSWPFIKKPHEIGCREYYLNIRIEHPLSSHKIYEGNKKLFLSENSFYLNTNQSQSEEFQPNSVILPCKQLRFSLSLKPLFQSDNDHFDLKFQVDLNNEVDGTHVVQIKDQGITLLSEFSIISDNQMRSQIVRKMSYKYKRPYQLEDFVTFNKLYVQLKNPGNELNPESQKGSFKEESEKSLSNEMEDSFQRQHTNSPNKSVSCQPEKIEIPVQSQFVNYIKTQIGSKQFQKKAELYNAYEIDDIITQIIPSLHEIILHQYANYMFQSLLKVCNAQQRMKIIIAVQPLIPFLVCQHQGTFVFQELVLRLTEVEEYTAICKAIEIDFKQISLDNYGHYFLRKLFEKMPSELVKMFIPTINNSFVELSTSKNGVFIVQCVLKGLSLIQKQNKENGYLMKKFLDNLTLHTKQLIVDQFGNYLIQEAFQSIQLERLKGVTQYITTFFADYACQKFSSNVVLNCVKKFWKKDRNIYSNLKNVLDNKTIKSIYQNKEGNKVLLQIMELNMELGLKDKISSSIRSEESKFNNRRWVSITGKSKTGAVGTNYTSFSEAQTFTKRKHYN